MRFARHRWATGSPAASRGFVRTFALLPAHRPSCLSSPRNPVQDCSFPAQRRIVPHCAALVRVAARPLPRAGDRFSSLRVQRGARLLRPCSRTDVQALHESCNAGASHSVCDARYSMRGLRRSHAAADGASGFQPLRLASQLHERKGASNEPVTEDHTRSIVSDSATAFRETIRPRLEVYVPVDPNPRFVRKHVEV